MVNFQRVVSGVTGREPGFTVNLNVVPGALRRAWTATGHWLATRAISSGMNVGVALRLGSLTQGREAWWYPGRDVWWHPSTEEEAETIAAQVFEQLRTAGVEWLDRMSDADTAIDELLNADLLLTVAVAPALLVERPGDERRSRAAVALSRWTPAPGTDERRLRDWLLAQLGEGSPRPTSKARP